MMDHLLELVAFLARTLLITFAVLLVVRAVQSGFRRPERAGVRVTRMNEALAVLAAPLVVATEGKAAWKRRRKELMRATPDAERTRVYVLDFEGDIGATEVDALATGVSAILEVARPQRDEVIVRLESPGGVVPGYGLGASHLARITAKGVHLTVCVDRVAASGGYLMACEADRIVSAPYAMIGSIGVASEFPNVHRLLERLSIDWVEVTAGPWKRTATVAGEMNEERREKIAEDVHAIFELFRSHVAARRPNAVADEVATGQVWHGEDARRLGLVDEIATSEDILLTAIRRADVYHVEVHRPEDGRPLGRFRRWVRGAMRAVAAEPAERR